MSKDVNKILKLIKLCARVLLENGAETYRVETAVLLIGKGLGFREVDIFAVPTGVYISLTDQDGCYHTVINRVLKRTVDLYKIEQANSISRELTTSGLNVDEAISRFEKMILPGSRKKLRISIMAGLSSGFFTLLFHGIWIDFFIAFTCGFVVQYIAKIFRREDMFHFFISLIGGVVTAAFAICFTRILGQGNFDKIIMGSMMPLLPGLAMTNAIRDAIRGDLLSGISRGVEALLVATALASGAGIVLKIWTLL